MAKNLRDIISKNAGRNVPKGEEDFLAAHTVNDRGDVNNNKNVFTAGNVKPEAKVQKNDPGMRHGYRTLAAAEKAYEETEVVEVAAVAAALNSAKNAYKKKTTSSKVGSEDDRNVNASDYGYSSTGSTVSEAKCNMTAENVKCPVHGLQECWKESVNEAGDEVPAWGEFGHPAHEYKKQRDKENLPKTNIDHDNEARALRMKKREDDDREAQQRANISIAQSKRLSDVTKADQDWADVYHDAAKRGHAREVDNFLQDPPDVAAGKIRVQRGTAIQPTPDWKVKQQQANRSKAFDDGVPGDLPGFGANKRKSNAFEETELGERKMSDAEMSKREDIVKGMKKNIKGFKEKYGKRAKEVMYATATKKAMEGTDSAMQFPNVNVDNAGFNI